MDWEKYLEREKWKGNEWRVLEKEGVKYPDPLPF